MKIVGATGMVSVDAADSAEQRVAAIARHQRGRVARRQLLAVNLTSSKIHRLLAGGWLHRLHRGVYAVGHLAPIDLGPETAALLACREDAVLSHHSAAALWGLRRPMFGAPVDVLVVDSDAPKRPGIKCRRTRALHQTDQRLQCGLPVTSAARTLLDITTDLTTRELEWALDEALAKRIVTPYQLTELLNRSFRRPGASTLRGLLQDRTTSTRTRSQLEESFLRLVRDAQLPTPEVNARLHGFLVDFFWRAQGLVVEVDGFQWHATKSAFERDHRKDAALRSHGLGVIRFSARQVLDGPYAVVADVAGRLQRAA